MKALRRRLEVGSLGKTWEYTITGIVLNQIMLRMGVPLSMDLHYLGC